MSILLLRNGQLSGGLKLGSRVIYQAYSLHSIISYLLEILLVMIKMYVNVENIFKESLMIVPALKIINIITNHDLNIFLSIWSYRN